MFQIDKQLATGEYFLNKEQLKSKKQKENEERHVQAAKKREERRQQVFVPPEEPSSSKKQTSNKNELNLKSLKEKILKAQKGKPKFGQK